MSFIPRLEDARELMDDPECEPAKLRKTYRAFETVNRIVSGWKVIFKKEILPIASQLHTPIRLLDVGCGGGDICLHLAILFDAVDIEYSITGIDPDIRAINYAEEVIHHPKITFRHCELEQVDSDSFDIVISNHLIHHLQPEHVTSLLKDATRVSCNAVIMNDIRRSLPALIGFPILALPYLVSTFVVADGLISIRRSYVKAELSKLLPNEEGWQIKGYVPFRNIITWSK